MVKTIIISSWINDVEITLFVWIEIFMRFKKADYFVVYLKFILLWHNRICL